MTVGCRLNRRLRRFSQMGYDAPRPFVPGFWVPACAKGVNGVLCFSLGSRLRGNDGRVRGNDVEGLNRRLRRFSQMGYDASRPFVPGFWVPACPKGVNGVLCFSLGSRLRGNDGGVHGNDGGVRGNDGGGGIAADGL